MTPYGSRPGGLGAALSIGFLAALPVNRLLVRYGVKEGMMNPKEMKARR